ncbi:MAG: AMP-dependent synthetase/ligase [Mycobacteriales bacterium]
MREYAVAATFDLPPTATLLDAVHFNAETTPDHVCFGRKVGDRWEPVSARAFAAEMTGLAAGLAAAGIVAGDRVGLLCLNRYEWALCDYALWSAGAVGVPVYVTSSPEQVAHILRDSGAVAVITDTPENRATVEGLRPDLPALTQIWTIDAGDLDQLAAAGERAGTAEVDRRRGDLCGDSTATIIYTSGTTGRPKGCELTHHNLLFDATSATAGLAEVFTSTSSTLLFLPLSHVFARVVQVACVITRARLGHSPDIRNLSGDLESFRPTFLLAVPRVIEKIYAAAQDRARAEGGVKRRIFERAAAVAIAHSEARDRGGPGAAVRGQHALFRRLVYGRLGAALGGEVRYAVSGGAALGPRLGHFFRGAGVTVLEGYGLTETSAGATLNTPTACRIGSVGPPMPGTAVRIADDGEVLVRGPHVFRGYWGDPAATAEIVGPDGWLLTGDLGDLDDDGFLTITGRKKEILVTAGGKNVAPAALEDRLRAHPLVSSAMVVGDARPYVGALLTLDPEAFSAWKAGHGKPAPAGPADLRDDPDLRAELAAALDAANAGVSRAETIKRFRVMGADFTEAGGELTPKLGIRRGVIAKQYAADIDALYDS